MHPSVGLRGIGAGPELGRTAVYAGPAVACTMVSFAVACTMVSFAVTGFHSGLITWASVHYLVTIIIDYKVSCTGTVLDGYGYNLVC